MRLPRREAALPRGGRAFYGCSGLSTGDREAIGRRFGDGVF
jgi:hypothetical protein